MIPRRVPGWFALLLVAAGAAPVRAQEVYWLDTRWATPSLNRALANGTQLQTLALPAGSLPEALALDLTHGFVYWTEATFTGARVRRAGLDFSSPTDVLTGSSALRGIAVDATNNRLFFSSSSFATGPALRRVGADGSGLATIAGLTSASNPRAVAYQPPPSEYVYLADRDGIQRWTVAGSGSTLIPTVAGARPYGLALDLANNRAYWTQYGSGSVYVGSLVGGGGTPVYSGLGNPTYLALDATAQKLYWVEGTVGAQRIRRGNTVGGSVETLNLPVTRYGGVAVIPASLLGTDPGPPLETALASVSPNPVRGTARITFRLAHESPARLSVLDVQGREVALLAEGSRGAGVHEVDWSAARARAGVYFARLQAGSDTFTRRFLLVR